MARVHSLLLTTTIVAGLGLSGLTPAGAGPNMPNMPSISAPNISPTRPDFNMRAPNALRDRDLASPRDPASLTPKKSKRDPKPYIVDTKPKKKATDTASRGKGSGPAAGAGSASKSIPPIAEKGASPGGKPAGLAASDNPVLDHLRAYLDAINMSAAERLGLKELLDPAAAAAHTLGGGGRDTTDPKGDITSRFSQPITPQAADDSGWAGLDKIPGAPRYGGGSSQRGHRGGVFGWGAGGAPSQFDDPSGQVSNDWHLVSRTQSGRTTREYWKNNETGQTNTITTTRTHYGYRTVDETRTPGHSTERTVIRLVLDGESTSNTVAEAVPNYVTIKEPFVIVAGAPNGGVEGGTSTAGSGNSPDDQPVAEGTGRPGGGGYEVALQLRGGRRIVCDFFGCRESAPTAGRIGDPGRNNPEGTSTVIGTSGPSAGPGAATDPCPDCGPARSGGTSTGDLRPSDVGWTGPGGGGPEGGRILVPEGSGSASTSGSRP